MRFRTLCLTLLAALLACATLDSFLYNPQHVDHYALAYAPSVPQAWRVPTALRRELTLQADDATPVYAVMLLQPPAARALCPTVLYHHGNKSGIDEYWVRVSHLWSLGANVLIYEYPGYGRASGTPTEQGIYRNALVALRYLHGLGAEIDQQRVFHYGYSLGGGPALETASNGGPYAGLITESIFASVAALVADGSLVVPASFVSHEQFDNLGKIVAAARASSLGVLLMHGSADDFVDPKYLGQLDAAIGAAAPHHKVLVPGASHTSVPDSAGYDALVREFLQR
jgi:pimeloyl-ACP methyl ester carboxylesterase